MGLARVFARAHLHVSCSSASGSTEANISSEAMLAAMGTAEEQVSMTRRSEAGGDGDDEWRGEPLTIASLCMNCYQNVRCRSTCTHTGPSCFFASVEVPCVAAG